MPVTVPLPSLRHTYSDDELFELNTEFEHAPASKIIRWAVEAFGPIETASYGLEETNQALSDVAAGKSVEALIRA